MREDRSGPTVGKGMGGDTRGRGRTREDSQVFVHIYAKQQMDFILNKFTVEDRRSNTSYQTLFPPQAGVIRDRGLDRIRADHFLLGLNHQHV